MYGSFDAGNTVHNSEPEVNKKMEELGKKMNIKGHIVGAKRKVEIYGPADIEVHKGKDGKYYVLDFARYMPPEVNLRFLFFIFKIYFIILFFFDIFKILIILIFFNFFISFFHNF